MIQIREFIYLFLWFFFKKYTSLPILVGMISLDAEIYTKATNGIKWKLGGMYIL